MKSENFPGVDVTARIDTTVVVATDIEISGDTCALSVRLRGRKADELFHYLAQQGIVWRQLVEGMRKAQRGRATVPGATMPPFRGLADGLNGVSPSHGALLAARWILALPFNLAYLLVVRLPLRQGGIDV